VHGLVGYKVGGFFGHWVDAWMDGWMNKCMNESGKQIDEFKHTQNNPSSSLSQWSGVSSHWKLSWQRMTMEWVLSGNT
jgi:hypothetical protein